MTRQPRASQIRAPVQTLARLLVNERSSSYLHVLDMTQHARSSLLGDISIPVFHLRRGYGGSRRLKVIWDHLRSIDGALSKDVLLSLLKQAAGFLTRIMVVHAFSNTPSLQKARIIESPYLQHSSLNPLFTAAQRICATYPACMTVRAASGRWARVDSFTCSKTRCLAVPDFSARIDEGWNKSR